MNEYATPIPASLGNPLRATTKIKYHVEPDACTYDGVRTHSDIVVPSTARKGSYRQMAADSDGRLMV